MSHLHVSDCIWQPLTYTIFTIPSRQSRSHGDENAGGMCPCGIVKSAVRTGIVLDDISNEAAVSGQPHDGGVSHSDPAPDKAGLRVRLLEARDRDSACRILKLQHARTVFRNQPFSDRKFERFFDVILSRPSNRICLVADWNGEVVGGAWASADGYILSDGPPFSTVDGIAVDPDCLPLRRAKAFIALIAGLKQWAASIGASHTFVHVNTGSSIKATDRLMRASGAKFIGGAYVA